MVQHCQVRLQSPILSRIVTTRRSTMTILDPIAALDAGDFRIRPWRRDDARSLQRHADDERVSQGLSDRFPFPYALADAEQFLAGPMSQPDRAMAIEIDGEAVGGISHEAGVDVQALRADIGYWLGASFWNRGLMRRALPLWVDYLFHKYPHYQRLQALVFASNPASARVLALSGFRCEGVHRCAVIKRGLILDTSTWARLRDDARPAPAKDA